MHTQKIHLLNALYESIGKIEIVQ